MMNIKQELLNFLALYFTNGNEYEKRIFIHSGTHLQIDIPNIERILLKTNLEIVLNSMIQSDDIFIPISEREYGIIMRESRTAISCQLRDYNFVRFIERTLCGISVIYLYILNLCNQTENLFSGFREGTLVGEIVDEIDPALSKILELGLVKAVVNLEPIHKPRKRNRSKVQMNLLVNEDFDTLPLTKVEKTYRAETTKNLLSLILNAQSVDTSTKEVLFPIYFDVQKVTNFCVNLLAHFYKDLKKADKDFLYEMIKQELVNRQLRLYVAVHKDVIRSILRK